MLEPIWPKMMARWLRGAGGEDVGDLQAELIPFRPQEARPRPTAANDDIDQRKAG